MQWPKMAMSSQMKSGRQPAIRSDQGHQSTTVCWGSQFLGPRRGKRICSMMSMICGRTVLYTTRLTPTLSQLVWILDLSFGELSVLMYITITEQLANIATGIADVETNTAGCMTFVNLGDATPPVDYVYITQWTTGCFYEGGGFNPGTGEHRINLETPGCTVR